MALDRLAEDAILALDPERISERQVRDVLSLAPAPRIISLEGSLPLMSMRSFADFLGAMGYPENKIRNPNDGSYSYSSYANSEHLAGTIAWHYERDGMMPMLIGFSQGGMLAIKVLYEFAGEFRPSIAIWNPLTNHSERRVVLRDPLTGFERPVIGLKVGYVAAIGTGKLMRVILGQWDMLSRLRQIPDTVEDFTGFFIEGDPLTMPLFESNEADRYRATGSAKVRNVMLPPSYSHLTMSLTDHLAADPRTSLWVSEYDPNRESLPLPRGSGP